MKNSVIPSGNIEKSLYNNSIRIVFTQSGHRYVVNGVRAKGVTTYLNVISKPALVPWAVNLACDYLIQNGYGKDEVVFRQVVEEARALHKKKKDGAADFGTLVHDWLEHWIIADIRRKQSTEVTYFKLAPDGRRVYGYPETPTNEDMKRSVQAVLDWIEQNRVVFLETEQLVYSKMFQYAGKFDFSCVIAGKKYLGDFKTSKSLQSTHAIQAAAYRMAIEEEAGKDLFDGCVLIKIPRDGEIAVPKMICDTQESYDKYKTVFKLCVYLFKGLEVVNKDFPYVRD